MVATVTETQTPSISPQRLRFARALASGATNQRAYQLAVNKHVSDETAASMGCRWAARPEVKAKVRELQDAADESCTLRIAGAKRLLSETAQESPNRPPSHSERVAAIGKLADLSGWVKRDEQPITVAIQAVLAGLGSPVIPPSASVNTPTPVDSQRLADTGGAPIATERVGAMGGNTVEKSENRSFYNSGGNVEQTQPTESFYNSPLEVLSGSEPEKNPGCGVFTNELGEEEVG